MSASDPTSGPGEPGRRRRDRSSRDESQPWGEPDPAAEPSAATSPAAGSTVPLRRRRSERVVGMARLDGGVPVPDADPDRPRDGFTGLAATSALPLDGAWLPAAEPEPFVTPPPAAPPSPPPAPAPEAGAHWTTTPQDQVLGAGRAGLTVVDLAALERDVEPAAPPVPPASGYGDPVGLDTIYPTYDDLPRDYIAGAALSTGYVPAPDDVTGHDSVLYDSAPSEGPSYDGPSGESARYDDAPFVGSTLDDAAVGYSVSGVEPTGFDELRYDPPAVASRPFQSPPLPTRPTGAAVGEAPSFASTSVPLVDAPAYESPTFGTVALDPGALVGLGNDAPPAVQPSYVGSPDWPLSTAPGDPSAAADWWGTASPVPSQAPPSAISQAIPQGPGRTTPAPPAPGASTSLATAPGGLPVAPGEAPSVRRPDEDPRTGALRLAAIAGAAAGEAAAGRRILATGPISFDDADDESDRRRSRSIPGSAPMTGPPSVSGRGSGRGSFGRRRRAAESTGTGTPVDGLALGGHAGAGDVQPPPSHRPAAGSDPSGLETSGLETSGLETSGRDTSGRDVSGRDTSAGGPADQAAPADHAVAERAGRSGRAGRNLPAAIGVGVLMAAAVLSSLLIRKEAFVGLVCASVVLAVWELANVLASKRIHIPVIPLAVGSLGMLVSAFVAREEGLLVSFTLTAFGVLLWRIIDGLDGAAKDIAAAVFTAAYVPFLAGFAIIMLAATDGAMRVLIFIAVVVASDVGGYTAGVLFGRHPMAPTVSPKKSWEGFAGSVVLCMAVAVAGVVLLLHGPWWAGLAVGAAAATTATVGDLSESLLKRDLGVKDMGTLLPGHGGMMDRLDSLLPTAPAVYLLLTLLVPPT